MRTSSGLGCPGVPVFEAHAAAVGEVVRRAGLIVSTLNVVGDVTFDPFGGPEALATTINGLAAHMRWAAAMGAPRRADLGGARREPRGCGRRLAERLRKSIEAATARSRLRIPPPVSCELHPFTFALKHRALPELSSALKSVGAGICFDFCHFGVALGRDLLGYIDDDVVDCDRSCPLFRHRQQNIRAAFSARSRRARPRRDRCAHFGEADRAELGSVWLARSASRHSRANGYLSRLRAPATPQAVRPN